MLTSVQLVFYLTCLVCGRMGEGTLPTLPLTLHQERLFISANMGESLTLECFHQNNDSAWLLWYWQPFDQEPKLISSFYNFDTKVSLHGPFQNDPRFSIKTGPSAYHLIISDLKVSDAGTYFCSTFFMFFLKFAKGATVIVKEPGLNVEALIDQSVSGTFRHGGSVTLTCVVHRRSCNKKHEVYWFKDSAEPNPKVLYTNTSDPNRPNVHSCVHHMSLNSLNQSHVGTYYCAVVACGHILFGNGTKLDFECEGKTRVLVYSLIGALTLSTSLVVLLSRLAYRNHRNRSLSTGVRFSSVTEEDDQDTEDVNYAALSIRPAHRSGTQKKSTSEDCVYSTVKK